MWYSTLWVLSDPEENISLLSGLFYSLIGFLMGFFIYLFNIIFVFHVFGIESEPFRFYALLAYIACGVLSYLSARGHLKDRVAGT